MGSLYSNAGGIQVLLDDARDTDDLGMVQQLDSDGRIRLHCAAWGVDESDEPNSVEADQVVPHATTTIELLMAAVPSTVSARDERGDTPLHFSVRRHGRHGGRHVAIPRLLCEHGADACIVGRNGETQLHGLGFRYRGCEPVDAGLVNLLLECGASVGDADADSSTPLHFAAKHLAHMEAARDLLTSGADVSATNRQGTTPVHEAAAGSYFGPLGARQPLRYTTLEDRVRAQDEMTVVLLHSTSETQANAEQKTPRQICQERNAWMEGQEDARSNRRLYMHYGL
ncbi:putative ankyrin repeat-containing [Diaporthe ampelina]|uniref:Putative ankyrin repeat-containing n=1 Tax=Diaporthe ampelina TaxID=1214573 RepID=A0A0G2I749_9PEZI|nr:putative ankyrin repeat-containing [Diaporthe ampelina]